MIKKIIYGVGENSRSWKGNGASYHGMHSWIRNKYGKPASCEKCGLVGKMTGRRWSIEYALKTGKKASRERTDYLCLCKSCHRKMDMTDVMRKNISCATKGKRLGKPAPWKRKEFCIRGHKKILNIPCKDCNRITAINWYRKKYGKK